MTVDKNYLKKIVDATAAGTPVYVGQAMGQPMVAAGLIEINTAVQNPADATEVICRSTPAAVDYLAAAPAAPAETVKVAGNYAIMKNVALPAAKRRGNPSGNGAPTKYPFEGMEVGDTFFSGNSEHKKGDAVKALGSTISSQNKKYSTETGEHKTVTRAIRDKQTHKAVLNADGSKQTETVSLPVLAYRRKFTIRPVEGGVVYGDWTAPENGALIARTK
jgi:hypothetical protein